jgi:hypothetical protein
MRSAALSEMSGGRRELLVLRVGLEDPIAHRLDGYPSRNFDALCIHPTVVF